ncbi:DUF2637 domain-containing protein [Streptomyces phyllanthi]|uniref:DUF2637 domain-containing protein n=1 Tax=Streptomyces phyllanthi TaxID=1803180 RepID=UPI001D150DC2|nr:DUF2637 domain-containing protein [Streptomyces phyllanthi]
MTVASTSTALGAWDRAAIVTLGGAGCALSYDALQQMAVAIHVRGLLTYLFPAVIDGFIAYGVRALILTRTAPLRARLYVWTLFGTATAASIWANALHAIRLNQLDQTTASGLRLGDATVGLLSTIAPLALAGAVHLYILIARHPRPDQRTELSHWSAHRGDGSGPVRSPLTELADRSTADQALIGARIGPRPGPDEGADSGPELEPVHSFATDSADRSATADGSGDGLQTVRRSAPQRRTGPQVLERPRWTDGVSQPPMPSDTGTNDGAQRTGLPLDKPTESDNTARGHLDRSGPRTADRGSEEGNQRIGPQRSAGREGHHPAVGLDSADQRTDSERTVRKRERPVEREPDEEDPRTGPHETADRGPDKDREPEKDDEFEALLAAVRDIVKNEPVLKRTLLRAALDRHNNAVKEPSDKVQVSNERLGPILQRLKQERQTMKPTA